MERFEISMWGRQDKWFGDLIEWRVGDDKNIRFWEDRRVSDLSLQNSFLRIFSNSGKKERWLGIWGSGEMVSGNEILCGEGSGLNGKKVWSRTFGGCLCCRKTWGM